jgi:hypothetical protein
MLEFFIEGGWAMWPILIFGMVTTGGALRFAQRPELGQLRFIAAMGLTTAMATVHATWLDIGSVFRYLEEPSRAPDAEFHRILVTGLKESTRPGSLGALLLMLACLLVAVGLLRVGRGGTREGGGTEG